MSIGTANWRNFVNECPMKKSNAQHQRIARNASCRRIACDAALYIFLRFLGMLVGRGPSRVFCRWRVRAFGLRLCVVAAACAAIPRPAQCGVAAAMPQAAHKLAVPVAVFGVVTLSPADPKPVPGVQVQVFSVGRTQKPMLPPVQTNKAGLFTFDAQLRPGKYIFEATKGLIARRMPVAIAPSARWYRVVHIEMSHPQSKPMAQAAADREFGVAVFGQATKADGVTPLTHALVGVGRPRKRGLFMRFVAGAKTNKSGLFAIMKRLGPGRYAILVALRGSENMVAVAPLQVAASSRRTVVVRLRAEEGSVRGCVVDGKGHPVSGAIVILSGVGRTSGIWLSATTKARGRYFFRYVPAGTYSGIAYWNAFSSHRAVVVDKHLVRENFRMSH